MKARQSDSGDAREIMLQYLSHSQQGPEPIAAAHPQMQGAVLVQAIYVAMRSQGAPADNRQCRCQSVFLRQCPQAPGKRAS